METKTNLKKQRYQIFLTTEEHDKLKHKAIALGITGAGWFGRYLAIISKNETIFIDDNFKNIMKALGVDLQMNGG